MELTRLIERYSVNEIKRQGEIMGRSLTRFRAWGFDRYVIIVDERVNAAVAVFDAGENGLRPVHVHDWDLAGRLMLAGAGLTVEDDDAPAGPVEECLYITRDGVCACPAAVRAGYGQGTCPLPVLR